MIKMKNSKAHETVKAQVRRNTAKKIAASAALCLTVLAVGAVSVYGFTSGKLTSDDNSVREVTSVSGENTPEPEEDEAVTENEDVSDDTSEYSQTVTWWKAGIEDYDFKDVTEAAATTTKKKTTTTASAAAQSAPKTSTTTEQTTSAKAVTTVKKTAKNKTTKKTSVEDISGLTVYSTAAVNVRSGAGSDYDILGTLAPETGVSVTGRTADGWYRIKYGDKTGYVTTEYFTDKKPDGESEKTTENTEAQTEAEQASVNGGVISYTDEEFEMLCYVLQGEVGNCSEASKIAVANVIINRVRDPRFADSISGVLTAPNQFTAITGYYNRTSTPSENTRECALRALQGEDNSNGAVYYYAPQYCGGATAAWFETLDLCLELDGQRYFK